MTSQRNPLPSSDRRLRWQFAKTSAAMAIERAAQAFWPAWTIVFAFYALLAFSNEISAGTQIALVALCAIALSTAIVVGAIRFHWPKRLEIRNRLDAGLSGSPLAAIEDKQAIGVSDPQSVAVWNAHIRRMLVIAQTARASAPDLKLSATDTFALRYTALTAFVVALLFAPPPEFRFDQLSAAAGEPVPKGDGFEAWVMPPSYTKLPGVYLNQATQGEAIDVPAASITTIQFHPVGGPCSLGQEFGENQIVQEVNQPQSIEFEVVVDGTLTIGGVGCEDRNWNIVARADSPPTVAFSGEVERGINGDLRLPVAFTDDYGVQKIEAWAEIDLESVPRQHGLAAEPTTKALPKQSVALPFSASLVDFERVISGDYSRHPWTGLPAMIKVQAEDGAGGTGVAEVRIDQLPSLEFLDADAKAYAELHRDLGWSEDNVEWVQDVGRALTHRADESGLNLGAYLLSRLALHGLEVGTEERVFEASELFWQAALLSEGHRAYNARQEMKRAAERLFEAMQNGASQQEIARLMQRYQEAVSEYLRQLRRQAQHMQANGAELPQQGNRSFTQRDIARMLEDLQSLLEQGRTDEAMQMLAEMSQMLQNSTASRSNSGQAGGSQQPMSGLEEALRRQQGLTDEAFRQLQEQRRQSEVGQSQSNVGSSGGSGSGQDHFGQGAGQSGGSDSLLQRQRSLVEDLQDGLRRFEENDESANAARQALESALREMTSASDAIARDNLDTALQHQHQSMRDLAAGIQALRNRLRSTEGGNNSNSSMNGGEPTDPFGRILQRVGQAAEGDGLVPNELNVQRSRALRDEIRRRAGEMARPDVERDYLLRLLGDF